MGGIALAWLIVGGTADAPPPFYNGFEFYSLPPTIFHQELMFSRKDKITELLPKEAQEKIHWISKIKT